MKLSQKYTDKLKKLKTKYSSTEVNFGANDKLEYDLGFATYLYLERSDLPSLSLLDISEEDRREFDPLVIQMAASIAIRMESGQYTPKIALMEILLFSAFLVNIGKIEGRAIVLDKGYKDSITRIAQENYRTAAAAGLALIYGFADMADLPVEQKERFKQELKSQMHEALAAESIVFSYDVQ